MPPIPPQTTFAGIVANWNGEAFIERALGSVLAAVRRSGRAIEVIVYDDASEDRSPELIARGFPGVRLIRGEANVGFGAAVNRAVAASSADWVFLLNNDLALQVDFFERLLAALEAHAGDPPFAIGARTLDWETGAANHGGQSAVWDRGLLRQTPFESEAARPSTFFQAGACLVDRARFTEIGGFSPLFHPGYWEDYDLAWQAAGRGWGVLYEPRAAAWHLGKGSMRRRLGEYGVSLALRRNHLIFNWLNLREPGRVARHCAGLGGLVLGEPPAPGEAGWGRALLSACGRLPAVLAERRRRLRRLPSSSELAPPRRAEP